MINYNKNLIKESEKFFNKFLEKKTLELPIYKIEGKFYFLDKRLNEYRNIKNPSDRLNFNDIDLKDLEIPTEKDKEIIFNKPIESKKIVTLSKGLY